PRRPADGTANIENVAVLCNCNPVSLTASGGQTPRMKMLEGSKDFRAQILRVVSQFSQCGVDPRKHARSRPMRLNIRRAFSHGAPSRRLNEGSIVASEQQSAATVCVFLNVRQLWRREQTLPIWQNPTSTVTDKSPHARCPSGQHGSRTR